MTEMVFKPETMPVEDARRITERIRITASNAREALEKLPRLVDEAKAGSAHVALGYKSWTAYLSDVLGSEPLRLPREQRQELVGYLAGEGMSTRAIAPIVGSSDMTVRRDLAAGATFVAPEPEPQGDDRDATPEPEWKSATEVLTASQIEESKATETAVTGRDGKTYSRPVKVTETTKTETYIDGDTGEIVEPPSPAKPHRRPLTAAFFDVRYDIGQRVRSLAKFLQDDRFASNRKKVAEANLGDLLEIQDLLQQVVSQLTEGKQA